MRLAIFFIAIAIISFCISRLQAMSSSSSKGEWVEGKVLLTGKILEHIQHVIMAIAIQIRE